MDGPLSRLNRWCFNITRSTQPTREDFLKIDTYGAISNPPIQQKDKFSHFTNMILFGTIGCSNAIIYLYEV